MILGGDTRMCPVSLLIVSSRLWMKCSWNQGRSIYLGRNLSVSRIGVSVLFFIFTESSRLRNPLDDQRIHDS